ncbi:patatin-like phospholipase family protein [uncultured Sphingomonas sp.]|uniref:patatin-like phospholipase family protein n=1 Tax=uncultured Sphingomonas sp. TaxID=158754 RepID=UPI0035CC9A63
MAASGVAAHRDFDVVLVLSGGNALGAFQAGVYQALHEHDLQPDWIVGASIGAINGALIAGSVPERRIETLRTFWRPQSHGFGQPGSAWFPSAAEITRRTGAATWTLATGRSGIFGPLLSSLSPWTDDRRALFDTGQLSTTLAQSVDFDELNGGRCRFTATAVDLATGDDVAFDSRDTRIDARHIRASAALPVVFPPVEIDDRWLIDGGISANLPLDPVLGAATPRPVLCLAVDLLPLAQALPRTLGETASRMQDLIFAAQSRRTIARWQGAHAGKDDVGIALVRLPYADQAMEVAGKALDFSGATIEQRWAAGHASATRVIARLEAGSLPIGDAGLNVVEME